MADDTFDDYDDENPLEGVIETEALPDIWADPIGTFSRN